MSKLKLNITMSIDGFVAGPGQSSEHPLGIGGEELHGWLVPLKAFRESHGEEGGEVNASTPFAEDILPWRCRAQRRSTSSRKGSSRHSTRRGQQPERRRCLRGRGVRRAAVPRSGSARRYRRLGRPDLARRRRPAVLK